MTESIAPANSMGSGENISTYDPLIKIKSKKKLRSIIGRKDKKDGN